MKKIALCHKILFFNLTHVSISYINNEQVLFKLAFTILNIVIEKYITNKSKYKIFSMFSNVSHCKTN